MESFSVSTVLNADDWSALSRAARLKAWSPEDRTMRILVRAPFYLLIALVLAGVIWLSTEREMLAFCGGILGTFLLALIQTQVSQRLSAPTQNALFFGPTRYSFDVSGIEVERPDSSGRLRWNQVLGVESVRTHVIIWLTPTAGYLVPGRDLSGGLTTDIVAERLRALLAGSRAAAANGDADIPVHSMNPPAPDAPPSPPQVALAQEAGAVGKLLALLRVDPSRLVGSDRAIALLAGLALVVWLPLDGLIYPGPLEFMPDQVGGLACVIAAALALAWILSRLCVPRLEYRRVLLIVAGAMFIAIAGSALFTLSGDSWVLGTGLTVAVAAYATQYFKLALRSLTGAPQTRALLVGAFATLLFVLTMDRLYINAGLWVYTGDDDAEPAAGTNYQDAWRRIEDVQFGQQARIDAQVAQIATRSAPGPQVYFVGFAGFGEQREFAQEIMLAARRVAERYDANGREVLLINDRRNFEKYPLATALALQHTLKSLGKVMDADDVLFLALSSHGDDDATLSVSNAGMMPSGLDAGQLAEALRESGIRWKVIVISACYAGSFIDALADDHTLVLTAAAADRTSFGCADDRDLTYFGEAFYRDAWPHAASLRAAFEAAKISIAQREKVEGLEASNPQASYGAAMTTKLEALEAK
jgi:Peptidase C13 family